MLNTCLFALADKLFVSHVNSYTTQIYKTTQIYIQSNGLWYDDVSLLYANQDSRLWLNKAIKEIAKKAK